MRTFVFLFIISSIFCHAQSINDGIPPYTLKINDSTFIDKSVVPLSFIREQLTYSIVQEYEKEDSLIIEEGRVPSFDVFVQSVFLLSQMQKGQAINKYNYTKYANHIFLTTERKIAMDFCKWRTDAVNKVIEEKDLNFKVIYRLPTIKELNQAMVFFTKTKQLKRRKPRNPSKYKIDIESDKYLILNLPEFTADESTFIYENTDSKIKASKEIGFRCICDKRYIKKT